MDPSKERKITANIHRQQQMLEDQQAVMQAMLEHALWLNMQRIVHLAAEQKRLKQQEHAEKLARLRRERVESVEQAALGAVSSERGPRSRGKSEQYQSSGFPIAENFEGGGQKFSKFNNSSVFRKLPLPPGKGLKMFLFISSIHWATKEFPQMASFQDPKKFSRFYGGGSPSSPPLGKTLYFF